MRTKFVKVSVEERLPDNAGWYYTWNEFNEAEECFYSPPPTELIWDGIKFWLEEVPDKQEEMIEILEELITHHFDFMGCGEIKELQEEAKKLIQGIKIK